MTMLIILKRKKIRKNSKLDFNLIRKKIYRMKRNNFPVEVMAESTGKSVQYVRTALCD